MDGEKNKVSFFFFFFSPLILLFVKYIYISRNVLILPDCVGHDARQLEDLVRLLGFAVRPLPDVRLWLA